MINLNIKRFLYPLIIFILLLPVMSNAQYFSGEPQVKQPPQLRFNWMGPNNGRGRASAIVGIPGDTMTYYVGGASGGIWKSTNGGSTFKPIFDNQSVQAIGDLAIAKSDTSIIWAGTGEPFVIRDQVVPGNGVYKSLDGGKTWQNMGLEKTGRIADIAINPENPKNVYVCALGLGTGPQQERGVFRTKDGGKTWKRVHFVNPKTGCSDMNMDPKNPNIILIGTWQFKLRPWVMVTGGEGSGIYITYDGGDTWKHRTESDGLPKPTYGKTGVAIAPSNPKIMYALIETANDGTVYRSDDKGKSWKVTTWDRRLTGRAGYYMNMEVNPGNPDEILVANSGMWHSVDGGKTFTRIGGCGDCHDIWFDPLNPDHWGETGDGDASATTNHGKRFKRLTMPIGQVYHLAVDNQTPYFIYSNEQDDGVFTGPSTNPAPAPTVPSYYRGQGIGTGVPGGGPAKVPKPHISLPGWTGRSVTKKPRKWHGIPGGCESGFTIPKPGDPNIIWFTCYGSEVIRYDAQTNVPHSVGPVKHSLDWQPNKLKYRCHWTPPLAYDPFDPNTVYFGCNVIFRTKDGGRNWKVISPDLSTQTESQIVYSGGLTTHPEPGQHILGDNLGQFYGDLVFAIGPSKIQEGLIWAGTNDGQVWNTQNGGKTWNNVTKGLKDIPKYCTVRRIYPSQFNPAKAYLAMDCHLVDDYDPYFYKTDDYGKTWTKISKDLPSGHTLDYTMTIAENPNKPNMLFAGTANAFYYSMNDGKTWTHFNKGLPAAPVSWIAPQKRYHDIAISTYGRGIFVLRNIVRLEQKGKAAEADGPYLYKPRVGIRKAKGGKADLLFSLKKTPSDSINFKVKNSKGTVVRTFNVEGREGLNKITWNLHFNGPEQQVKLRTKAPYVEHIWEQKRFQGKKTRPVTHWGIGRTKRIGPLAAPGKYTVLMMVNGKSYKRSLKVVKDPSLKGSAAGMKASTQTQIQIRNAIDTTTYMINHMEGMRKQIQDLLIKGQDEQTATALRNLNKTIMDTETQLLIKANMNSDDKWYVSAPAIYQQLVWLYGEVGTGAGNVAGGSAHSPTKAMLNWFSVIKGKLNDAKKDYKDLVNNVVPSFNQQMREKIPPIVTGGGSKE